LLSGQARNIELNLGLLLNTAELSGILDRLGSDVERWQTRLEKLRGGRPLGRFFAASQERLREVATHLGVHHVGDLKG